MKNVYKKTGLGLILFSLVFSLVTFAIPPQKAEAQIPVTDALNLVQNTLTAINTGLTASQVTSMNIQNSILNTIATLLAKAFIRALTAQVVNWINSGFQGSPTFVQNPGSFFLDVADQATGEFLAKSGGPLSQLCSPFSIDIRLALSFKYHPRIHQRYTCTLGAIINNAQNADVTINGRSLAGFMSGDFKQGGIKGFVSLTTEPQNNIYGAYLTADSDLSFQVANLRLQRKDEVSNGQGFISWRNPACKRETNAYNEEVEKKVRAESQEATEREMAGGNGEYNAGGEVPKRRSLSDCKIETPGSLVVDSLRENIASPLRELGLVDSINEIVGALAAQLVNTILQGGLAAISGASASDTTAYVNQIQAEAAEEHVTALQNDFATSVAQYVSNALSYKINVDQAVSIMADVKDSFETAKECFLKKGAAGQTSAYQSRINEIDSRVTTTVIPSLTILRMDADKASSRFIAIVDVRDKVKDAKNLAEIDIPTKEFNRMLQSKEVVTTNDVQESKLLIERTSNTAAPLKQEAQAKLIECQSTTQGGYRI